MSTSTHSIDRLWLVLSSPRSTAVITTALALFATLAAIVPQGSAAIELLQFEHAQDLRKLSAWGLTNVFESAWIRALGVLLVANILAVVVRTWTSGGQVATPKMPSGAPHEVDLSATLPERAVEALRVNLRAALGTSPAAEHVDGAKVTMVFDTSPRGQLFPLLAHIGLVFCVIGAGLLVSPPPLNKSVVRAHLDVTDSRSGYTGHFDLAQGEPIKFFQWRPDFIIRGYVASKNNMGPAIQMERIDPEGRRSEFWIYRDAPKDFDQKHRRGIVSFDVVKMGLQAAPGYGLSSNSSSVLLLLGFAFIIMGAVGSSRAAGRLWVEAEGDRIRLLGVPTHVGDPGFAKSFGRLELVCRAALAPTR